MRKRLTKFGWIFECGAAIPKVQKRFLDSKGVKACKSCRSRQELSNELFTCKIRLRYSRERASQRLPEISQKVRLRLRNNIGIWVLLILRFTIFYGFFPDAADLWMPKRATPNKPAAPKWAVKPAPRRTGGRYRVSIFSQRISLVGPLLISPYQTASERQRLYAVDAVISEAIFVSEPWGIFRKNGRGNDRATQQWNFFSITLKH